ncbi:MAG: DEAD/DEAH box helicase, partial [Pseudomonadota bacterium]
MSVRFDQLQLHSTILKNVLNKGYDTPSPIQAEAIPLAMKGRDILGSAQTGTGKTAAFALPILHRLHTADEHRNLNASRKKENRTKPRALILAPTRELATQIADGFKAYSQHTGLRGVTIFGGVGQVPQVNAIQRGVDVIVATPGRLLDLMNQGHANLTGVQTLVLDEADRMLDMGFIHDITKITAALPKPGSGGRQTLFFSATLPPAIRTLAKQLLRDPAVIKIAPDQPAVETVHQTVRFVDDENKADVLADLLQSHGMFRTIVFTRTKHGADKVVRQLKQRDLKAEAIHGNKSQNARQRALNNFKEDETPVLVATDVAARGIDV